MINQVPFLYDPDWHTHEIHYNEFYDTRLVKNCTIVDNNVMMPILIFDKSDESRIVHQGGFFSVTPYLKNREDYESSSYKKLVRKFIIKSAEIASENEVTDFRIHQFPLQTINRPFSYCQELGYETLYRGRSMVDFRNNEIDQIWSHVRTRYRGNIRKVDSPKVHYGSIPQKVFSSLVDRHLELAGRKTKPDMCWDILEEFVNSGRAMVIQHNRDFLFFFISEKYAYYAISAAEKNSANITHALMWRAVEAVKEIGCEILDIGIYYPSSFNGSLSVSESSDLHKIKNISYFKNGFANTTIPDFYSRLI